MRRITMLIAVALLLIGASEGTAAAGHARRSQTDYCSSAFATDDGCHMALWIHEQARAFVGNASQCTYTAAVTIMEIGKDGVQQIKMRFELRAPYDPGLPWLAYAQTGFLYTRAFPDDEKSNYGVFALGPNVINSPTGGTYSLRIWSKGVRPGWWRTDHRLGVTIADNLGCAGDAGDGGGGDGGGCYDPGNDGVCLPPPQTAIPN